MADLDIEEKETEEDEEGAEGSMGRKTSQEEESPKEEVELELIK